MKTEPQLRIAFYLATFLLVVAVIAVVIQKRYEISSASVTAKVVGTLPASSALSLEAERGHFLGIARVAEVTGFTAVLLGMLCWVIAIYRRERPPRSLLIVLIGLYVLLQLMMV